MNNPACKAKPINYIPNRINRDDLKIEIKAIKMKNIISCYFIGLFCLPLFIGCKNTDNPNGETNTTNAKNELSQAFKKMWDNVTYTHAATYFKTDVADDFYTIGADGIAANKEQLLADTARLKLLEMLKFKFFDQHIKVFGTVGIINGRIQAFSGEKYVAEILFTAVFVKENGIWKYENWQGTWSKNSTILSSAKAKKNE